MKNKKEVNGTKINIIFGFGLMFFVYFFIYFSYELFHWPRIVYAFIILALIPITWSQFILAGLGKKTIGYIIADKINNRKKKNEDSDLK